jgi:hypothetical protein
VLTVWFVLLVCVIFFGKEVEVYYASTLLLLSSGTCSEVRHGFLFLARVLNFEQINCIDTFVTI